MSEAGNWGCGVYMPAKIANIESGHKLKGKAIGKNSVFSVESQPCGWKRTRSRSLTVLFFAALLIRLG